ncbi:uncharacterized membrane protein YsdA (DUF1294 family) [Streptohalobacillus salinus]|uniref:Uncharacterized membrane protein YsdA (DUF1294 family) n=1 Tax=Streptohalobacillus salinus TaxID=621096 RepID=A0A2V3W6Y7_9BACI|nr:DUF1294 domain-containing protein [Streptohalobacillus salinus]PXW90077.1 uncharacterized membrane protein YsdA (DUF1294 family) [Streptohalobacillus salinus]
MQYLFMYVIIINGYGFWQMRQDKKRAQSRQWRYSEKRLWLVALAFGAMGSWIGMRHYRHKTKHVLFKFGMPLLAGIEMGGLIYLVFRDVVNVI